MLTRFIIIAALSVGGASVAQAQSEKAVEKASEKSAVAKGKKSDANKLSAGEKKSGWKLLFDGKTLKGWRGYKKDAPSDAWQVVDGAITLTGKGGDLITADQYGDFELAVDWRVAPKGNSGIIYRSGETDKASWATGIEYQVLDDAGHPDATAGKEGNHKAGALYDVYPPSKAVVKPAGEWNQTKIVARGNHIEHWLNGEKVVEAEIGSEDWKKRVAASKWSKMPEWSTLPKGHFVLQDHGDKVEYRNIRVRELKGTTAKIEKSAAEGTAAK